MRLVIIVFAVLLAVGLAAFSVVDSQMASVGEPPAATASSTETAALTTTSATPNLTAPTDQPQAAGAFVATPAGDAAPIPPPTDESIASAAPVAAERVAPPVLAPLTAPSIITAVHAAGITTPPTTAPPVIAPFITAAPAPASVTIAPPTAAAASEVTPVIAAPAAPKPAAPPAAAPAAAAAPVPAPALAKPAAPAPVIAAAPAVAKPFPTAPPAAAPAPALANPAPAAAPAPVIAAAPAVAKPFPAAPPAAAPAPALANPAPAGPAPVIAAASAAPKPAAAAPAAAIAPPAGAVSASPVTPAPIKTQPAVPSEAKPEAPIRLAQAKPTLAAAPATGPAAAPSSSLVCDKPDGLGLARVVEIDTAGGPGFGFQHFKQYDFLRPNEVVLTFDDGPWPHNTPAILKALADHCLKATFFPIGKHATWFPDLLRQVAAAGHTIGSHTWSHKDLSKAPYDTDLNAAKEEIEMGVSAVHLAVGEASPFFRFPALRHPPDLVGYLGERNIGMFSTDFDSFDFKMRKPEQVVKSVMEKLRKQGKGIVLMHDFQRATAEALPEILRQIKEGGYRVVHMKAKSPAVSLAEYEELVRKTEKLPVNNTRPTSSVVKTISE